MTLDERLMARALELAMRGWGTTSPNPLVGAVIARGEQILAEGWHERAGGPHAEVMALEEAQRRGIDVRGATMYVNLEPCSHYGRTPPCTLAIIRSGLGRVVSAMEDPNPLVQGRGHRQLERAGIAVTIGVLEEKARQLNEVFIHYITQRRPFVHLKMAASLDGKTATVAGASRWISGSEARAWVHRWRARYGAVGVGVNTVIQDDPMLTARDEYETPLSRQPLRLVFDPALRIPRESRLVRSCRQWPVLVVTSPQGDPRAKAALEAAGVQVLTVPETGEGLDLKVVLDYLYQREIDSLFLEGGGETAWKFAAAALIDKVSVFFAPLLIGGRSAPGILGGNGFPQLETAQRLRGVTSQVLGQDLLVEAYVEKGSGGEGGG